MGECLSSCIDSKKKKNTKDEEATEGDRSSEASKSQQQSAAAAADALAEEVVSCAKVPSFDWRFRKGFQSAVIGPEGAKRLAAAMRDTPCGHAVHTLELQCQMIKDAGAVELAAILRNDRKIVNLNLAKCGMTDAGVKQIAAAMNTNDTLERLLIDGNLNGSPALASMCRILRTSNETRLRELHVGLGPAMRVTEDAALALQELFSSGSSPLRTFSLIGEPGCVSCPPLLLHVMLEGLTSPSCHLEELLLASLVVSSDSGGRSCANDNTDPDLRTVHRKTSCSNVNNTGEVDMFMPMQTLGNALSGAHSRLKKVELKAMHLGNSGASGLASGIAGARCLKHLVLRNSGIGDAGWAAIAEWGIQRNTTLRKLEIDGAHATAEIAGVAIARSLEVNSFLRELTLLDVAMTDEVAGAFVDSLSKPKAAPLRVFRHSIVASDSCATRLANILTENEKRCLELDQQQRTHGGLGRTFSNASSNSSRRGSTVVAQPTSATTPLPLERDGEIPTPNNNTTDRNHTVPTHHLAKVRKHQPSSSSSSLGIGRTKRNAEEGDAYSPTGLAKADKLPYSSATSAVGIDDGSTTSAVGGSNSNNRLAGILSSHRKQQQQQHRSTTATKAAADYTDNEMVEIKF